MVESEQFQKNNTGMTEPSPGKAKLGKWLNRHLRIALTDGRALVGVFLCTDKDANVILGSCTEYRECINPDNPKEEPRILGLAMVPGKHIVSIQVDEQEAELKS